MDTPFSTTVIASLTAQPDQITTDKPVSLALLLKAGTEPTVSTDAQTAESGMSLPQLVSAPLANSGTDLLVSFAPTAEPGTSIPKVVNAPFPPLGTELLVLPAQEEESTITTLINVNAQQANNTTDSSVPSTAQPDNSTTKPLRPVPALLDKTGTETFVFTVTEVKLGTPV